MHIHRKMNIHAYFYSFKATVAFRKKEPLHFPIRQSTIYNIEGIEKHWQRRDGIKNASISVLIFRRFPQPQ